MYGSRTVVLYDVNGERGVGSLSIRTLIGVEYSTGSEASQLGIPEGVKAEAARISNLRGGTGATDTSSPPSQYTTSRIYECL